MDTAWPARSDLFVTSSRQGRQAFVVWSDTLTERDSTPDVLIADDDEVFAQVVSTALVQEGYSTRTVETFDEALNALTTQTWSLLLLGTWGAVRQEGAGRLPDGRIMNPVAHEKVTPSHLKRNAYLYVRQSTLRQVFENTESTKRQYALRQRAIALGWSTEQIVVIDCDLGQSGASAVDRAGFQQLVAEVGLDQAGIVLGLEVSRHARSSTD